MRVLDLAALNAPEFLEYVTADPPIVADGEFVIGMEFSSREVVVAAIKDYTIHRGVDYRVYESEPTTFYAKCVQYSNNCNWLIRSAEYEAYKPPPPKYESDSSEKFSRSQKSKKK
ncbi:hypothetical protein Ahy_A03g014173 [Arachis hypogaea]|uniref:Transposase MuDR plant domain-containing protein n=1 Tax=Arachis hypogaea TaxID=3818 RepID=A0A445DX39_ARAHY|nr:hypothetical protein Ahy_A03g014173 [Arachis hypogaea]